MSRSIAHQGRADFLLVDTQISTAAASDSLGNLAPTVKGHDSGAGDELITGNGPPFCRVFAGIFREPMPRIGVRRAIMQCRAHDNDRAAPAA